VIVRIVVCADYAEIFSPFEAKNIIKAIPTRSWSKPGKCWQVDIDYINMAADSLRHCGYTVFVTDLDGKKYGSTGTHGKGSTPAADWVAAAFAAAPKDRCDKMRRGLLVAFHPDVGGDPEVAKRINAEADRRLGIGGRRA